MQRNLRQKGFSKHLNQKLKKRFARHQHLSKLSDDDVDDFISELWIELANLLHKDIRVFFEGRISFFRKAIKRRCFNMQTKEEWFSYKMRVRTNILEHFRNESETDISMLEYEQLKKK